MMPAILTPELPEQVSYLMEPHFSWFQGQALFPALNLIMLQAQGLKIILHSRKILHLLWEFSISRKTLSP
jgi:hypothetical protein